MSKLDGVYIFHLRRPTTDAEHEIIRQIPGTVDTRRGRDPRIQAPLNAGWLVAQVAGELALAVAAVASPAGGFEPRLPADAWGSWKAELEARGEVAETVDGEPFLSSWLKPFQQEAIAFIAERKAGVIWASGGSGKTPVAVVAALCATFRTTDRSVGAILAVTRGGARDQWAEEAARFSRLDVWRWKPTSARRKKDRTLAQYLDDCGAKRQRPFVVAGHEQLVEIEDEVCDVLRPGVLILDEVHESKAPKRADYISDSDGQLQKRRVVNQSSAAFKITTAPSVVWRIATTATPIYHRAWDLWGQLSLVEPYAWSETVNRFRFRYCGPEEGEYGYKFDGLSNVAELRQRLSFSTLQIPYQVSHGSLPPKRRRITTVPVEQQKQPGDGSTGEIKKLLREIGKADKAQQTKLVTELREKVTELRIQAACLAKRGVVVDHVIAEVKRHGELVSPESDIRRKGKCIVMVGRVAHVEIFAKLLTNDRRGFGMVAANYDDLRVFVAHGEISGEEREKTRKAFMADPGPAVFVATYQSSGASINLHDCDYMALAQLPVTPGELDQIEARVHRLAMKREVLIEYFVAERTIDQRLKAILLDKLPSVEAIMGTETAASGLVDTLKDIAGRPERMSRLLASISEDFDSIDLED